MEIENRIPCILICQDNFLEIYNKLKQKYENNVSLVSLENSKWIYTNANYYETIIKESKEILGEQEKCYNIVSTDENNFLASPLGKLTICSFECKSDELSKIIQNEIANALSSTTFERFGKTYLKPIPLYIKRTGDLHQIYIDSSNINNINNIHDITNEILIKYSKGLNSYTNINLNLLKEKKNINK